MTAYLKEGPCVKPFRKIIVIKMILKRLRWYIQNGVLHLLQVGCSLDLLASKRVPEDKIAEVHVPQHEIPKLNLKSFRVLMEEAGIEFGCRCLIG